MNLNLQNCKIWSKTWDQVISDEKTVHILLNILNNQCLEASVLWNSYKNENRKNTWNSAKYVWLASVFRIFIFIIDWCFFLQCFSGHHSENCPLNVKKRQSSQIAHFKFIQNLSWGFSFPFNNLFAGTLLQAFPFLVFWWLSSSNGR